jgi:hypothetical protein
MHTPWATDWKEQGVLPASGVLERTDDSRWAVTSYQAKCGHWVTSGGNCGVYLTREAAVGALLFAAEGQCWNCLMDYMKNLGTED